VATPPNQHDAEPVDEAAKETLGCIVTRYLDATVGEAALVWPGENKNIAPLGIFPRRGSDCARLFAVWHTYNQALRPSCGFAHAGIDADRVGVLASK